MEKQLPRGFLAQAGYVGDRQIKQLQVMNVNVGTPGGDAPPFWPSQRQGIAQALWVLEHVGSVLVADASRPEQWIFASSFSGEPANCWRNGGASPVPNNWLRF